MNSVNGVSRKVKNGRLPPCWQEFLCAQLAPRILRRAGSKPAMMISPDPRSNPTTTRLSPNPSKLSQFDPMRSSEVSSSVPAAKMLDIAAAVVEYRMLYRRPIRRPVPDQERIGQYMLVIASLHHLKQQGKIRLVQQRKGISTWKISDKETRENGGSRP